MHRLKRIIPLGIIAGLLAALALAVPAQAGEVKAVCQVAGNAKAFDKEEPNVLGVRVTGGSGNFTFQSPLLICTGWNKGAPFHDIHLVQASGVYDSIACGLGKAVGTVDGLEKFMTILGDKSNLENIVGNKFAVEFFGGGEGIFYWKANDWDKQDLDTKAMDEIVAELNDLNNPGDPDIVLKGDDKPNEGWAQAGFIQLGPPSPLSKPVPTVDPPPDPRNCTKSFEVTGEVLIDDDGIDGN